MNLKGTPRILDVCLLFSKIWFGRDYFVGIQINSVEYSVHLILLLLSTAIVALIKLINQGEVIR